MKQLALINPLDDRGERVYTVGENCDAITELAHGGYLIVRGTREDTVPGARVERYTHNPRHGLTREPELTPTPIPKVERNGLSPEPVLPALGFGTVIVNKPINLPKGVAITGDETAPWGCISCSFRSATVHGVKVHFAKSHG